uniref:Ubiquitin carboxyl-terminal hydrolase n=1 Tax=Meloidogyne incognita TaxID=6306 RepID=A0A914LJF5_MELIC
MTSPKKLKVQDAKQLLEMDRVLTLHEGQTWYVISSTWWREFLSNAEASDGDAVIEMPPISNKDVVEKNDEDQYVLKPNISGSLSFVSDATFTNLRSVFGIEDEERDVISRKVVKGMLRDEIFIEVYPLQIKVANYNNKEVVFTVEVSQAASIDKIREIVFDQLKIEEQHRNRAHFLIEDKGRYDCLSDTVSYAKLSAILHSGAIVYVDASGATSEELVAAQNGTTRGGRFSERVASYQKGLCGLQNLGNTCFMNSAIQCLSNVPELTEYFINDEYYDEINTTNPLGTHGRLVKAYAELLKDMWSGCSSSVRPCHLKCVIGEFAPRFNGYAQQDSQELTAFLLDGLHEDLNRIKNKPYVEEKEMEGRDEAQAAREAWQDYKKRNDSIIVDLLHGQLKSTLTCNVCSKISIKFDPFCYLSLPIPAKERQVKSTINFVRKDKWAKFLLTHTNKTTILQLKDVLRQHLKIPPQMEIVLLTYFSSDILEDDKLVGTSYNNMGKQFYAYALDGYGPLLLVENRTHNSSLLGNVFPVRRPDKLTKQFVLDSVLPLCRDYFWRTDEGTSAMDNNVKDSPKQGEEPIEDDAKPQYSQVNPDEIGLLEPNLMVQEFPEDPNEEMPLSLPYDGGPVPKIMLTWEEHKQFSSVNPDSLVEREVSITQIKKAYTIKECIDAYTTKEQLSEQDSWFCPNCKTHQRAFKKLDLWSLPQILIIHLKRFLYTRYSREKIETEIDIPVKGLDLGDKVRDPSQKEEKYDLIGISNHSGGLGSGHYTARALNNNTWCEFNDSSAYALNTPPGDSIVSKEAYMLVYRRRQTNQQQIKQQIRKSPRIAAATAECV